MKLIAHRGNYLGPNTNTENTTDQINKALSQGFDVEVDIWCIDGNLYLGHDNPRENFSLDNFPLNRMWCHAKNVEALSFLRNTSANFFWQENDDYSLTSKNQLWCNVGKFSESAEIICSSIIVMPERDNWNINKSAYGICSDYVMKIKNEL